MILVDTDVLSAMAKVTRLPLFFFTLFQVDCLHIAPGVFRELAHSFSLRRQYAEDKQTVHDIVNDLQVKDRMQFKQSTIEAIFAE